MDFAKYVSLLHMRCLYFCRADQLREVDKWEGSLYFSKLLREAKPDVAEQFASQMHFFDYTMFVNCWHRNQNESYAMWRLYASRQYGIAVCSTFGRLKKSLENYPNDVHIAKVIYRNVEKEDFDNIGIFEQWITKRKEFKYENELRAMIWDPEAKIPRDSNGGIFVSINLHKLIKLVYISPASNMWFKKLVETVTRKYGLEFEVKKSPLLKSPPI